MLQIPPTFVNYLPSSFDWVFRIRVHVKIRDNVRIRIFSVELGFQIRVSIRIRVGLDYGL